MAREGLAATYYYLAQTINEAAVDVLVAGLDSDDPTTRDGALETLLKRRSPAGHLQIFRRLPQFDERSRAIVHERPERLLRAVRAALKAPGRQASAAACEAMVAFRLYEVVPALTAAVVAGDTPHTALLAQTALKLTESFYLELSGLDDHPTHKNQDAIRERITSALEDAVRQYGAHRRRELVEALLLIAKSRSVALRHLLRRPELACYGPLMETLSGSSRGGVIRLLLGFLEDPQMPRAVREALCRRSDAKFLEHLLESIGHRLSKPAAATLAQWKTVPWAKPGHAMFAQLDDPAQRGAVIMLMHTALPRARVLEVIGYLLLEGKPGGRRAAAEALDDFREPEADELVTQALRDEDPHVRAHALAQLRPRRIPGALSLLIGMVGSPEPEVQAALLGALPEFTFRQFMSNFDSMSEQSQPIAGHIVQQIDPTVEQKLDNELEGPPPVRRRALLATGAMGLIGRKEQTVIRLLSDEDRLVRAAAARVLADCKTMPTWEALRAALFDRSSLVQEAAEQSLQQIADSLQRVPEEEEETQEVAP